MNKPVYSKSIGKVEAPRHKNSCHAITHFLKQKKEECCKSSVEEREKDESSSKHKKLYPLNSHGNV